MKIGRCQHIYSSIAQSVERMTVNHDVTGSSPVGGAKRKRVAKATRFLFPKLFIILFFSIVLANNKIIHVPCFSLINMVYWTYKVHRLIII